MTTIGPLTRTAAEIVASTVPVVRVHVSNGGYFLDVRPRSEEGAQVVSLATQRGF